MGRESRGVHPVHVSRDRRLRHALPGGRKEQGRADRLVQRAVRGNRFGSPYQELSGAPSPCRCLRQGATVPGGVSGGPSYRRHYRERRIRLDIRRNNGGCSDRRSPGGGRPLGVGAGALFPITPDDHFPDGIHYPRRRQGPHRGRRDRCDLSASEKEIC